MADNFEVDKNIVECNEALAKELKEAIEGTLSTPITVVGSDEFMGLDHLITAGRKLARKLAIEDV